MTEATDTLGILIVSHGSPRAEANDGFTAMVGRVASRLGHPHVLPAFFSITQPNIEQQVAVLAARGVRSIALMPYFLYNGQHISVDIPTILDQCRQQFPDVFLELLPTLENDPSVEDVVVERLVPLLPGEVFARGTGAAIEQRSYEIIDRQIASWSGDPAARQILRRIIHATADVSFARTLRVHPAAVERGRAALAAARPIICDVQMVRAGLTKAPGQVLCAIQREEVATLARDRGCTRAAAAMEYLAPQLDGAIVAIGNAPTALWKILEIARAGGPKPAVVVGLPVGFVGARESKLALIQSNLCYISNVSARGGSPVAAAAVNALAMPSDEE